MSSKFTGSCYWKLQSAYHLIINSTGGPGFARYAGRGMITGDSNSQQAIKVVEVQAELNSEGTYNKILLPKDCRNMFAYCSNVKEFDLHLLDTSIVTNMRGMFKDCSKAVSINLMGWRTKNVHCDTSGMAEFDEMFDGCSSLKELDLSSFDTRRVEDEASMQWMFNNCKNLEHIYVFDPRWDADAINKHENLDMFEGCKKLHNRHNSCCADDSKDRANTDEKTGYLEDKQFRLFWGYSQGEPESLDGLNYLEELLKNLKCEINYPVNVKGRICFAYPEYLEGLISVNDKDGSGDENLPFFDKKNVLYNGEEFSLYYTRYDVLFLTNGITLRFEFNDEV